MERRTIPLQASSVLVNASDLTTSLFVNSDGTLSFHFNSWHERSFFFTPIEGPNAFKMANRDLPVRREDVLPINAEHLEATTHALEWRRTPSIKPGSLLVTSKGAHLIVKHLSEDHSIKVHLGTREWQFLGENETGMVAESWTLNAYVGDRVTLSVLCNAITA